MKLNQYNVYNNKSILDKEIIEHFGTKEVSLFTLKYSSTDGEEEACRDEGHIFLCRKDIKKIDFHAEAWHTLEQSMLNLVCVPTTKIKKLNNSMRSFEKNIYSINPFDGWFPFGQGPMSLPRTTMRNGGRSIITYVLCGYSELINPNLISSWGYGAVF